MCQVSSAKLHYFFLKKGGETGDPCSSALLSVSFVSAHAALKQAKMYASQD